MVRIVMGCTFFISGMIKASDLNEFSQIIEAFAVLPREWSGIAAMVVCFCEIFFGMGLVLDVRGSLTMILLLLLIFVFVLSYALYMGYDIDCGCFGPSDPETKAFSSIRSSLLRDGFMVVLVLYLYVWRMRQKFVPQTILQFIKGEKFK